MAFNSQLGRFGDTARTLTTIADFDQQAAIIISANGPIVGPRPNLIDVLTSKGFSEPGDLTWINWQGVFGAHRNAYMGQGGSALRQTCTTANRHSQHIAFMNCLPLWYTEVCAGLVIELERFPTIST